jgi:hypothetical protein
MKGTARFLTIAALLARFLAPLPLAGSARQRNKRGSPAELLQSPFVEFLIFLC